jgi:hypothetical protein
MHVNVLSDVQQIKAAIMHLHGKTYGKECVVWWVGFATRIWSILECEKADKASAQYGLDGCLTLSSHAITLSTPQLHAKESYSA